MLLSDLRKAYQNNDGTRSLFESVMHPAVLDALVQWTSAVPHGVVIGGTALSFHAKPRTTQDVDVLFVNERDIPDQVPGFKRTRRYAFQHDAAHVEIELVTPGLIHQSPTLIQQVVDDAVLDNGVRVASASGLVALKLGRLSLQDNADIAALIKTGKVDISGFSLSDHAREAFAELEVIAAKEGDQRHT